MGAATPTKPLYPADPVPGAIFCVVSGCRARIHTPVSCHVSSLTYTDLQFSKLKNHEDGIAEAPHSAAASHIQARRE